MHGHALYWVSQTLWWLGWVSVCGVGFGILSTVSRFWRSASTESRKAWTFRVNYQTMTRVSLLVASFFLGFLYNDHVHNSRMYPFTKMEVLRKYDDYNYQVRFVDDMLPWQMHVCPSYKVGWDEGMTVLDGAYEDAGGCKDFGVHGAWFKIERDPATSKFIDFRGREYAER